MGETSIKCWEPAFEHLPGSGSHVSSLSTHLNALNPLSSGVVRSEGRVWVSWIWHSHARGQFSFSHCFSKGSEEKWKQGLNVQMVGLETKSNMYRDCSMNSRKNCLPWPFLMIYGACLFLAWHCLEHLSAVSSSLERGTSRCLGQAHSSD